MSETTARVHDQHGNVMFVDVANLSVETNPCSRDWISMEGYIVESRHVPKNAAKRTIPAAKNVIFNPPATIVIWEDGTKTVVKCDERDEYDPKYGLALCYMKKAMGNSSRGLNDALRTGMTKAEKVKDLMDPALCDARNKKIRKSKEQVVSDVREMLKRITLKKNLGVADQPLCPCYVVACEICPFVKEPDFEVCTSELRNVIKKIMEEEGNDGAGV